MLALEHNRALSRLFKINCTHGLLDSAALPEIIREYGEYGEYELYRCQALFRTHGTHGTHRTHADKTCMEDEKRINLRVSAADKVLLEDAAHARRMSLTKYILTMCLEQKDRPVALPEPKTPPARVVEPEVKPTTGYTHDEELPELVFTSDEVEEPDWGAVEAYMRTQGVGYRTWTGASAQQRQEWAAQWQQWMAGGED